MAKNVILIIHDNPELKSLLEGSIRSLDFMPVLHKGCMDILNLIQETKPAAIIAEIDPGNTDCFDMCRRLKALPSTRNIVIILLSGENCIKTKIKAIKCGVDYYIEKPFHREEITAWLKFHLHKHDPYEYFNMFTELPGYHDASDHLKNLVSLNSRFLVYIFTLHNLILFSANSGPDDALSILFGISDILKTHVPDKDYFASQVSENIFLCIISNFSDLFDRKSLAVKLRNGYEDLLKREGFSDSLYLPKLETRIIDNIENSILEEFQIDLMLDELIEKAK